ncbi:MAG: FHA domain-containing protein [Chloroflexi bacterium]|nr:FHA domain-containing protein [Chloroflexota bacterium]
MTTEIILLLLRCLSGLLLVGLLVVLFLAMWHDFNSVAKVVETRRRTYGRLVAMREVDGHEVMTGETYPLLALTSLGRAPTNTIPISDHFASGEHALLAMRDGQWWLEDRNSRNGTTLNDVPVTEPVVIMQGDVIGIGQMKFRFELEAPGNAAVR